VQSYANQGTIFMVTPGGTVTTLHMFDDIHGAVDGANPYAGLIQGTDGAFYGTTRFGGSSRAGTVFKFDGSTVTVLHSFPELPVEQFPDGAYPDAALVQASDGNLYGTTSTAGAAPTSFGTLFRITTNGTFTKLWDFDGTNSSVNGVAPWGAMIQASDGNLYGTTTAGGGAANSGTTYRLTLGGVISQVTAFDYSTTGSVPYAAPLQAADGTLYITTSASAPA
jgi:uncharacterized repeat protein (TIGR03803 family)